MEVTDDREDIWIKLLPDGPRTRLTFSESLNRKPRWTPDGQMLTFLSDRTGTISVWTRNADGTGEAGLLHTYDGLADVTEAFWAPNGEWLVLRTSGDVETMRDILVLRPGVDTVPQALVASFFNETGPALSPSGRWLAYASDEQGRYEVFVRPFPDVEGGKVQVSSQGGIKPLWSKDGRELFFVDDEDRMVAAQIETSPTFRIRRVEELFTLPVEFWVDSNTDFYDVTADGHRFIMARRASTEANTAFRGIVLVQNFFTELEERVGR
jgi:serine/threonine-protein kinase